MDAVITSGLSYLVTTALAVIVGWAGAKVARFKSQTKTIDQIALMVCRLVIYSDVFDVDEKLEAYEIYKSKHGNHRTRQYMSELVGKDIDEYIKDRKAD